MRKTYHTRKIYEEYYGTIPTDSNGRSYDVHHIDGNYRNDDPKNLRAVSIEEHYEIHLKQGDYAAAHKIAGRMSLTKEELSELAKIRNKKWVEEGRHNWQGGTQQKEMNAKRVREGTHNFLGGKEIRKLYANKTPPWGTSEDVSERTRKQVAEGRHPWQDTKKQIERQYRLIQEGRHVSQMIVECPHCQKNGPKANMKRWHGDNCKKRKLSDA